MSNPPNEEAPRRLLCIDIEGGWGGSSRSLQCMLAYLDRDRIEPTVWHRRSGPGAAALSESGISHRREEAIISIIPLPKKNVKVWLAHLPHLARLPGVARRIVDFAPDILHLNYEGLVPLHALVCRHVKRHKTVLHMRTASPANAIYRAYARHINRFVDHLIFITENERDQARRAGVDIDRIPSTVLYNPVPMALLEQPRTRRPESPLNLIFLGTLDPIKAADRLVDLAEVLRNRSIPAKINVFGTSPRYKKLFVIPRRNLEDMRARVRARNLGAWIEFHGHSSHPEKELAAADLLLRPSRYNDPWGRDVIEALAAGVPVIANGSYAEFVRPGETGVLMPDWDVDAYADAIADFAQRPGHIEKMSKSARALAHKLFDPRAYSAAVMGIYESLLDPAPGPCMPRNATSCRAPR